MPTGRPPKPTRLRVLQGNPGKRPLPAAEVQPQPGDKLRCPAWLHRHGKAKWKELAPKLLALGLLTELDGESLAVACQAWAEFRLAAETLEKKGRTYETPGGQHKPHPAAAQQRAAWDAWRKASALFGLDPSGRVRVKAPGAGETEIDPLEALLNRASAN